MFCFGLGQIELISVHYLGFICLCSFYLWVLILRLEDHGGCGQEWLQSLTVRSTVSVTVATTPLFPHCSDSQQLSLALEGVPGYLG